MSDEITDKKNKKYVGRVLDYKKVFGSEQGERVLNDLISTHGMLRTIVGDIKNSNEIYFNEGERNVVLRILKMLSIDPVEIRRRIKEIEHDNSN